MIKEYYTIVNSLLQLTTKPRFGIGNFEIYDISVQKKGQPKLWIVLIQSFLANFIWLCPMLLNHLQLQFLQVVQYHNNDRLLA